VRPTQQARQTIRVGHFFVDVARRSLRFLNETAEQLHREGVPVLAADLAEGTLRTVNGQAATAADLPLYITWRDGRPAEAQFLLTRPGGAVWRVVWNASPLWGSNSRLDGVLGTVSCGPQPPDPDRLAELSHDLRSPLQALRLQCTVIERLAQSGKDMSEALDVMRKATERAVHLAKELLDCCRGPAPRSQLTNPAWFALEPFLKALADEQGVAAQVKGLTLAAELEAARGLEVRSDPVRLGRLLANLLVNAVRYTAHGRIALRAAWREEQDERQLEVSVIDTGPGIAEDEHDSIFQPYERGKAGYDSDSGGSGLGLAVVDRLGDELGLRVEVDSIWGRGSTFSVLVPQSMLRPVGAPSS
jgi:anti-sigma regulatory factor (Ser/Thr protein kinase)